jgi:hypothetical protein
VVAAAGTLAAAALAGDDVAVQAATAAAGPYYLLVNSICEPVWYRQSLTSECGVLPPGSSVPYTWWSRAQPHVLELGRPHASTGERCWSAPIALEGGAALVRRPIPAPGVAGVDVADAELYWVSVATPAPAATATGRVVVRITSWLTVENRTHRAALFVVGHDDAAMARGCHVPAGASVGVPARAPTAEGPLTLATLPVPNHFQLRWADSSEAPTALASSFLDATTGKPAHALWMPMTPGNPLLTDSAPPRPGWSAAAVRRDTHGEDMSWEMLDEDEEADEPSAALGDGLAAASTATARATEDGPGAAVVDVTARRGRLSVVLAPPLVVRSALSVTIVVAATLPPHTDGAAWQAELPAHAPPQPLYWPAAASTSVRLGVRPTPTAPVQWATTALPLAPTALPSAVIVFAGAQADTDDGAGLVGVLARLVPSRTSIELVLTPAPALTVRTAATPMVAHVHAYVHELGSLTCTGPADAPRGAVCGGVGQGECGGCGRARPVSRCWGERTAGMAVSIVSRRGHMVGAAGYGGRACGYAGHARQRWRACVDRGCPGRTARC